ncbi:MAG: hypothetical protein GYA51_19165 [Candidatus Methanofastidiosa archaeon]|nr:hypothetical protein [Candidatus Methanofastidiosa archaeon]
MKKIILLLIFIMIFSLLIGTVSGENSQELKQIKFEEGIITRIEAYDFLLIENTGDLSKLNNIIPPYYKYPPDQTSSYPYPEKMLDLYEDNTNLENFLETLTGDRLLENLEFHRNTKKLEKLYEICYGEYNKSDASVKNDIKDLRVYVEMAPPIGGIVEYTYSDYLESKNNPDKKIIQVMGIVFITDENGIPGKRNEILYDGVYLYQNYYIGKNQNLKWDINSSPSHMRFKDKGKDVKISDIFHSTTYSQNNFEYRSAKEILFRSFTKYYYEVNNYPRNENENWYFYMYPDKMPLIQYEMAFLKYNKEMKGIDKADLEKTLTINLKEKFDRYGSDNYPIFRQGDKINIFLPDDSLNIIQIDSEMPNYYHHFLQEDNPMLWWNFYGVKDSLLMNYIKLRLKDIEIILTYESIHFKDNMSSNKDIINYLMEKEHKFSLIENFIRRSRIINEQLYLNGYFKYYKQDDYENNLGQIERLEPVANTFLEETKNELDKRQWEIQKRQYKWALFFTIVLGLAGVISLILNYIFSANSNIRLCGIKIPIEISVKRDNQRILWFIIIIVPVAIIVGILIRLFF